MLSEQRSESSLGRLGPGSCVTVRVSQEEGTSGNRAGGPEVRLPPPSTISSPSRPSGGRGPGRPHGLQPAKLLCPWNSPGQTTGVGSCSLLLGIFPTYGSDPGLPHYMRILHHLNHQGSPTLALKSVKYPGVVCVICCLSYLLIT